jgi:hypothetical protein
MTGFDLSVPEENLAARSDSALNTFEPDSEENRRLTAPDLASPRGAREPTQPVILGRSAQQLLRFSLPPPRIYFLIDLPLLEADSGNG